MVLLIVELKTLLRWGIPLQKDDLSSIEIND